MNGETRVHIIVLGLVAAVVGLVVLFWVHPRLIIYGVLALVAALGYGALYLIVAAWIDPKVPVAPLRTTSGADKSTVSARTDNEPTTAQSDVEPDTETVTKATFDGAPTDAQAAPAPRTKAAGKKKTKKKTTRRRKSEDA